MIRPNFTDSKMLALGACILGALLSGCGLKGSLTLPEKSEGVIIRGPQEAAPPAATDTTPAETDATPEPGSPAVTPSPTTPAAPAPAKPVEEPQPPPSLPGGNPGTSRGG